MRDKRNRKKWKGQKIKKNEKLMSLKITEGSKVEAEERRIEQNIRTNKNEELVEPKARRIRRIRDSRTKMKATWKKGNRYEWKIKVKRRGQEKKGTKRIRVQVESMRRTSLCYARSRWHFNGDGSMVEFCYGLLVVHPRPESRRDVESAVLCGHRQRVSAVIDRSSVSHSSLQLRAGWSTFSI